LKVNNVLFTVIFSILLIFVLNAAYADSGPSLTTLQAEKIAQDYLDTHGYSSYKADIAGEYPNVEILAKVKVLSTGEVKWIDFGVAKADSMDNPDPKYKTIIFSAYVVDVLNANGAKVGTIYVNGEDGSIAYKSLPGSTDTNGDSGNSNNTTTDNGQNGDWLQNLLDAIMGFFQQIWILIFGQ
jgi:hypothetical protein